MLLCALIEAGGILKAKISSALSAAGYLKVKYHREDINRPHRQYCGEVGRRPVRTYETGAFWLLF